MTRSPTARARRLGTAGFGVLVLALLGLFALRASRRDVPVSSHDPAPVLSLLAVGDTGTPPGWIPALDGQAAVGFALQREDQRVPANALVLLGDNFYFRGLQESELVARVRENVVEPYCSFVRLSAPRSAEVAGDCGAPRPEPPPIFAVLGNHDWDSAQSPRLERERIPQFVANWTMPEQAQAIEVGGGVSLVLFDSTLMLESGDATPLREALRAARGPWRVLVAHHPIGTSRDTGYNKARGVGDYGALVREAVTEAGVPVQLMLAGHEHNLQMIRIDPPGPRLVVIAGGGSRPDAVETRSRGRLFALESLGFARIDLVGGPEHDRLVVTLFRTSRWRAFVHEGAEPVARWSVTRSGEVLAEPLSITVVEPS